MRLLYSEDLASRTGPESCVGVREGTGEALTGEHVGQVLSREISDIRGADGVPQPEGNTGQGILASPGRPRAVRDPVHAWRHLAREPGDPALALGGWHQGRIGKPESVIR